MHQFLEISFNRLLLQTNVLMIIIKAFQISRKMNINTDDTLVASSLYNNDFFQKQMIET